MKGSAEETLARLYDESSDKDQELAETGLAHHEALLEIRGHGDGLPRLLEAFTEGLERELGTDLLLLTLYGSHARGQAEPDSDVDILVVLRRSSRALYEKVRQMAYQVMWEADFSYVFSLYLTDARHYEMLEQRRSSFLRNVQREGKVLWKAM